MCKVFDEIKLLFVFIFAEYRAKTRLKTLKRMVRNLLEERFNLIDAEKIGFNR